MIVNLNWFTGYHPFCCRRIPWCQYCQCNQEQNPGSQTEFLPQMMHHTSELLLPHDSQGICLQNAFADKGP